MEEIKKGKSRKSKLFIQTINYLLVFNINFRNNLFKAYTKNRICYFSFLTINKKMEEELIN